VVATIETRDLLGTDLRELLPEFDRQGELRTIEGADWNIELGAITEMLALRDGPALMFDHVKDYPAGFRVLANLTNNPRRVGMLFGLPRTAGGIEIVRTIRERFTSLSLIDPIEVRGATFEQEARTGAQVNILDFPAPLWHEHDGGRYIGTACIVVTRDIDGSWVNLGTYRVQVHDERTLGLYLEAPHHGNLMMQKYWERGESAPIAVCIGVPPALLMSAFLAIPWGTSEYRWAGGLIGKPIETVRGEFTGLPLPVSAEIVIEGSCPPPSQETRLEGPFGETIGYYASVPDERPVIHVEAVYFRRDPILVGSPPLRPPASSSASYLFRAANLWNQMERAGIPDIKGVWMLPSGASSALCVVSIAQRYAGHVQQVGMAAMTGTAGAGLVGRYVIIVDEDIDPSDVDQVLWAMAMRSDPEESIEIIRHTAAAYLDPRIPPEKRAANDYTMSRAIIDACRPFRWRSQFPRPVGTSPEIQARIRASWPQLFE
jgi:4-hydroxy-3-polyprenylbenzoate decarboxylase